MKVQLLSSQKSSAPIFWADIPPVISMTLLPISDPEEGSYGIVVSFSFITFQKGSKLLLCFILYTSRLQLLVQSHQFWPGKIKCCFYPGPPWVTLVWLWVLLGSLQWISCFCVKYKHFILVLRVSSNCQLKGPPDAADQIFLIIFCVSWTLDLFLLSVHRQTTVRFKVRVRIFCLYWVKDRPYKGPDM